MQHGHLVAWNIPLNSVYFSSIFYLLWYNVEQWPFIWCLWLSYACLSAYLPASVPHKSNELPSMPPLSSINPPHPIPHLPIPSWTSDQLRPCPAHTARQHFLSPSLSPLSLPYPPLCSVIFLLFSGVGPAAVTRERWSQQKVVKKKKKRQREDALFSGCETLCTDVSAVFVWTCAGRKTSSCNSSCRKFAIQLWGDFALQRKTEETEDEER